MYDFIGPSFSKENSHLYSLSIQVSLNGFSFCIRDEDDSKLLVFKNIAAKVSSEPLLTRRLKEWFDEEEMLQLSFREKKVLFSGSKFSLLPNQLESEQVKADILKLIHKSNPESEQAENWIEPIQAKLIFLLPQHLLELLRDHFGDFKLSHVLKPVLRQLFQLPSENAVMLFFDDKEMFMSVKKEGQLVLSNVFRVNHPNDAIYYILSAGKQFKLNTSQSVVLLAGKATFTERVEAQLVKHFSQVFNPETTKHTGDLEQKVVTEFVSLW